VLSFRRGDVITYVTGSPSDPLQNLAKAFDDGLTGKLASVCVNQESAVAEATRSPWSTAGYKQYTEDATVSIAGVPLPSTDLMATPASEFLGPALAPAPVPPERVSIPSPGLVDHCSGSDEAAGVPGCSGHADPGRRTDGACGTRGESHSRQVSPGAGERRPGSRLRLGFYRHEAACLR